MESRVELTAIAGFSHAGQICVTARKRRDDSWKEMRK